MDDGARAGSKQREAGMATTATRDEIAEAIAFLRAKAQRLSRHDPRRDPRRDQIDAEVDDLLDDWMASRG